MKVSEKLERPSVITPNSGKKVTLTVSAISCPATETYIIRMDNMHGLTRVESDFSGMEPREMLQNRSAFDAMVNCLIMLLDATVLGVEYYQEEERDVC